VRYEGVIIVLPSEPRFLAGIIQRHTILLQERRRYKIRLDEETLCAAPAYVAVNDFCGLKDVLHWQLASVLRNGHCSNILRLTSRCVGAGRSI
jgi:hypothetical protein